MSNIIGDSIHVSIWGQSHSNAIGVTIDGLPAGIEINMDKLYSFMKRRAPGQNKLTTQRSEDDTPVFLSGLADGKTCGAPLTAVIYNKDAHSSDYSNIKSVPRPGHADYTAYVKYKGCNDIAGGGQFSGRLTAPMCIAGAVCIQILETKGIHVSSKIISVHGNKENITEEIEKAVQQGDSVGGIIECVANGVPAGLGEPMFNGMENKISKIVFGIPAVKGIEFGNGFGCSELYGSENNDTYTINNGKICTVTNNAGGILGGITNGMPLVFRVAIKPTPSIAMAQQSVNLESHKEETLYIKGRHDPCILLRALPCVESAMSIAIYDAYLQNKTQEN